MSEIVRSQLAECEAVIERGLRSFFEVGAALARIRDERLYREDFDTFEQYCRGRWSWGRNYVNKQIAAAGAIRDLGTNVPIPQNEAQARELAKLPPAQRAEAWEIAVERAGGQPTAAQVAVVVAEMTPPSPPTAAEVEAAARAKKAEARVEELLDERHAATMRNYSKFRRLIEAVRTVAEFHAESAADVWAGVWDAGGDDFGEHLRSATVLLTRLDTEHPNKRKRPGMVVSRPM